MALEQFIHLRGAIEKWSKFNCTKLETYPNVVAYYAFGYYMFRFLVFLVLALYIYLSLRDVYLFIYGRLTMKKRLRKYGEWAGKQKHLVVFFKIQLLLLLLKILLSLFIKLQNYTILEQSDNNKIDSITYL